VPRVSASSAPNGSSSNRSFGLIAKARAIETRWRMPPDSWLGLRLNTSALSPTISRCFFEWART
jgi:hypothetical protein